MNDFFTKNRNKFAEKMENGDTLVLFAGRAPVKRGDEFYPYAVQRNFYYMTGLDAPELIFVMTKNDDKVSLLLFVERFDEKLAKWLGAPLSAKKAQEISGIGNVKFKDELDAYLAGRLFSGGNVWLDLENRSFVANLTEDVAYASKIRERFAAVQIKNAYPVFAELRMIKEEEEIANIKSAIDITKTGILSMMKNARPGMKEYEIEAYFDFELKKRGVRQTAFPTIAAGGKNASILHYDKNSDTVNDGELILFDLGAQVNWYSADITRTFPVNGKFTERQKQLYNVVLEANLRVIDMIKPGIEFKSMNETVLSFYEKALAQVGLITAKEEIVNYYWHGVSHMLGLETHDAGRGSEKILKEGMVLTVEPGIYIEKENVGIRVEDDVLVTKTGCEVLSRDIIKTVDEIESFMSK